jgi:hypothetical protein
MAKVTEEAKYTIELGRVEAVGLYHLLGYGVSSEGLVRSDLVGLYNALGELFKGTQSDVIFTSTAQTL